MRPLRAASSLAAVATVLLQACGAGWHRTTVLTPESPRQQVEVWQGNASLQWHAVRVTDSTVSGIPYLKPIECDSCRHTVPRSSVDSIRLGNPTLGFWKSVAVILLAPFTLLLSYCVVTGQTCAIGGGT